MSRLALCPRSRRLAFSSPPAVHAGPAAQTTTSADAPQFSPYPAMPLSSMTAVDRVRHVVVATTSNLINGCIFGAFFGFVSGLWSNRAFRPALAESSSMAKSWAGISALYAGLQTASKVIRGKDDRYNALVGACGSGAAFQCSGGPAAAAQGCISFAALNYLIDSLTSVKQPDQSDEAILNKPR